MGVMMGAALGGITTETMLTNGRGRGGVKRIGMHRTTIRRKANENVASVDKKVCLLFCLFLF